MGTYREIYTTYRPGTLPQSRDDETDRDGAVHRERNRSARRRRRSRSRASGRSARNAAVILLQAVVHRAAGALPYARSARRADGTRVGVMPVRGHLLRGMAQHRLRSGEEALRGVRVPCLAQQGSEEDAVRVAGPVEGAPAPAHRHGRLVRVPRRAGCAVPPDPPALRPQRGEARLPRPDCFVYDGEAPHEDQFRQVAQAQFVAQAPAHDEQGAVVGTCR